MRLMRKKCALILFLRLLFCRVVDMEHLPTEQVAVTVEVKRMVVVVAANRTVEAVVDM
jgi:hypothetical protein